MSQMASGEKPQTNTHEYIDEYEVDNIIGLPPVPFSHRLSSLLHAAQLPSSNREGAEGYFETESTRAALNCSVAAT